MKTKVLLFKTGVAGIVKVAAAVISFIMAMAITRVLGPEQAGLFLLALTILSFFSVFLRLGLDNIIIRLISSTGGSADAISSLTTGLVWSLLATLIITLSIYFSAPLLSQYVFDKPMFSDVLSIMILALPFMVVFMVLGYAFQAFYRVIAATFFQNFGLSSLFLISLGLAYLSGVDYEFTASFFSWFYVSASIAVCFFAIFLWDRQINSKWGPVKLKNKLLWEGSSNLWVASTMNLAVHWSAILIAGSLLPASDVAFLSVALRTAMLASFVLTVVNMVVAPRYALLWKQNRIEEIKKLAKWSTRGMILLVLPIIILMVFFADDIMQIFGDEFTASGNLLAIIAVGQFVAVASGSVSYLLNMSGHERDFRRVTLFVGPLTILISFIFITEWGVLGAAIATAVGLSLQNLGALLMVRNRLGFWPVG